MKRIEIAGRDRTEDIGCEVSAAAERRRATSAPVVSDPAEGVLALRDADDEADYARRLVEQLRLRNTIRLEPFVSPRKPGWTGALGYRVRQWLWQFLRYQHHHTAAQQNEINVQTTAALEFQNAAQERQIAELRRRIERLEADRAPDRKGGESRG